MTLTTGPNLGLLVNGAAGEGHYTDLMKQWRGLDALVMPRVDGYLVNTPPASPADGYTAIIGAAPTGLWAGQGGEVTRWSAVASAYEFYTPRNGWTFQSASARETYRYTASAWEIYYQEGTWTPAWTGLTITGSPVYAGRYTVCGRLAFWEARISPNGGTTASAGGTTTYINNLPVSPAGDSNHIATQDQAGLGIGLTQASGKAFVPAWSASGGYFAFSGMFTR